MAVPGLIRGLSRPSTRQRQAPMRGGWVSIMTNRPNGILYTGVTSRLAAAPMSIAKGS